MSLMTVGPCAAVPGSALRHEYGVEAGGCTLLSEALFPEHCDEANGGALLPELFA